MSEPDDLDAPGELPTEPEPIPLARPSEGVPAVSVSAADIGLAAAKLATGRGQFAVDAERASGFRYSNRAYLIVTSFRSSFRTFFQNRSRESLRQ